MMKLGTIAKPRPTLSSSLGANEAFETPKPERLIERVLAIGSDLGDIVLDCFGGSGTTAAVAHKMGRRWLLLEREHKTVKNVARARLQFGRRRARPGRDHPDGPVGLGVAHSGCWKYRPQCLRRMAAPSCLQTGPRTVTYWKPLRHSSDSNTKLSHLSSAGKVASDSRSLTAWSHRTSSAC